MEQKWWKHALKTGRRKIIGKNIDGTQNFGCVHMQYKIWIFSKNTEFPNNYASNGKSIFAKRVI